MKEWDDYFLDLAKTCASRSNCLRAQVGAVIVGEDKKIKNSIHDVDKITGKKTIWIEKDKTKDFWEHGIMGTEYIAKALEYVAIKHVDDLLDYEDLDKYIEGIKIAKPILITGVMYYMLIPVISTFFTDKSN